ncbi:cardiac-enriched FHL2-interacting protein [Lycodopsis pacificus]
MTSVKKRRSGRKSGGHRKHSDGGYSDTSSGGSYPDETDREVSNLTDRAFRSLCIGDEAVYNDSDLCPSSPCTQRDRQLAFGQSGQNRDGEDKEREELKRPAHESFSLRMQQYGQDWIHGGIYEAEIQRDPQLEVYGERTQGRVSATFQHSFVENSQQEEPLGEEQSSFLSNGATELSMQQRRSRSRVSSLIRAFNSEGRDGAVMDGKVREWNDETSWDKSALMSIQREISELSTSYQQNFNSSHFPSAGPFSSPDTNFYSSEVAAAAHRNSASSFMRSSHSTHSMSEQFDCNSNFFIHSEFSPFKVWRDHNRFPFQQAEVSGFMHCSEFPKWYETPMYRELSLDAQPQGPYRFDERGVRDPRNTLAPVVPPSLPRSTSTSTIMQKASAVEKRCDSELTGHYPHRTWMQSLGPKRFPMQRSSTASPTSEMARRVQDTISSVKALQKKMKMMTEQNIATGITANQQGVHCSSNNLNPLSNNAIIVEPNAVSSSTSTTPFNISQLLTPLVNAHHEAETPEVQQSAVSPQPMEHPPVQAESRGATPDVRMSSYKSRATGLLFNLKDNRKRVKSTYSPTKFKGLETLQKNNQYSTQEPRDTVIDIPDFPDPDFQLLQVEGSSTTNAASNQYVNQYYSPGLFTTPNSQPAHTGLYSEYTSSDYQRAQMQSDMVNPSGFTGFIPENYASYRPANGQNLHEDLSSFTSYKQAMIDNVETLGGDLYRFKPSYTATEIPMLNADSNQPRAYLISKANAEQHFNETVGRDFTKVDRCQQLKENKHDYSNVSSQDRWRQTICQDTENLSLKAVSPWKQEITALMEKDQHAQAYQRADAIKEEAKSPSNKYRGENWQSINKELEKIEFRESFGVGTNSHKKAELVNTNISNQLPQNAPFSNDTAEKPAYYGQQQPGTLKDKYLLLKYNGHTKEDELKDNYLTQKYNRYTDQEHRNQHILYCNEDKSMLSQDTRQQKQNSPIPKVYEMQSLQPMEAKPQLENNMQKKSLSNPDNASAPTMANQIKDRQFAEVRTEQAMAEHIKAQHAQAELAKTQHWAQVEQPKAESARLILAGQTGSEKVKEDQAKAELTEEPRNITEEVNAEHLREERGEQVKVKQAEAERLKEEHIQTELAKTEQAGQAKLVEEVKLVQIQEQQAKAEQEKTKVVEVEKVKANHILVEDVKHEKAEEDNVQASRLNADQPTTPMIKAKEKKAEQAKLEQPKAELDKAELTKTESMQEKSAKPAAKLTVTQQMKSEPDKVEQVKTELAKAKAELAKIKEKMRGEQKERVRNTICRKEDGIKTDLPLKLNMNKNEENKDRDQATQMYQRREEIVVVSGQQSDQANRGSDEYERLRAKYGLIDKTSANRNTVSAARNVSSNDANERPAVSLDKVETTNNEKSKDNSRPPSKVERANAENKEEVGSFKHTELTESQYVYSESSKEFKLSGGNHLPKNVDKRVNSDTVRDKVKDDSALSSKERAQTKQEILTSKIKAHAEKQISAIKEKGFAVRDGFISKNSTKHLAGSQSNNIRQRPPSQEVPKKHESTKPSNMTPKHQMEPSGLQIETVKSVLPPGSATISVRSAATTSQLVDQLLKQVPKEPMKSNDNVPKPLGEEKKMGSYTMSPDEGLVENQKKEIPSEIKSTIQSKEQALNQEANQGEISGKQKEGFNNNPAVNTDHFTKKKEDPSQAAALVEAESSEHITTEKAESKHEAVHEDSAPSLNIVFGQNKTPVADDSLQITGIMCEKTV